MTEDTKKTVFNVLKEAYPQDLSMVEVSRRAKLSEPTGQMYIRVLEAEGKIVHSRVVGRSKMFQYKPDTDE